MGTGQCGINEIDMCGGFSLKVFVGVTRAGMGRRQEADGLTCNHTIFRTQDVLRATRLFPHPRGDF